MNLREELYVSGGGLIVSHAYPRKGGRRVTVIDPAKRTKAAIRACFRAGMTPRQAARALDLPIRTVVRLALAMIREKSWIISNLSIAGVGTNA